VGGVCDSEDCRGGREVEGHGRVSTLLEVEVTLEVAEVLVGFYQKDLDRSIHHLEHYLLAKI
jgi:hypothetical protein